MPLHVIGAGVGRTGTYSLKTAINQLGLGPCHHMEEVILNMPVQLPLWQAAADGKPNWSAIYDGYAAAVDWPTAGFYRELLETYPTARFVLTTRSSEAWVESFGSTIYELLGKADTAPVPMRPWLAMVNQVLDKTGFPPGLDSAGLMAAFEKHIASVKAAIPASQLLVFEVKQGWGPLCHFLGVPVPDTPFPRTNDRAEFWDKVAGAA
jgi:hypothetical protein